MTYVLNMIRICLNMDLEEAEAVGLEGKGTDVSRENETDEQQIESAKPAEPTMQADEPHS